MSLEILCPSLLAPIPERTGLKFQAPAIERLLARADRLAGSDRDPIEVLLRTAGVDWPAGDAAPSAPVALLGEGVEVESEAIWMHADPIHLRPDRDRLLVYAGPGVAPEPDEAEALVAAFNRHFVEDGVRLIAPSPQRWYLRLPQPPGLRTRPLHQIQGGSMAEHLPRGPESRDWMRLLNETQMLFHAEPVNRQREATGRPLISGIWIWGAGSRPALSGQGPDALIGDHPALSGLARLAARPHRSLKAWQNDPLPTAGRQLVFWDRHWRAWLAHDLEAWTRATSELDAVIERLWNPLRAGRLDAIRLDPCDGAAFRITSRQTRRFWRRRATLPVA
ncbi:phosphoglycerate mutase [Allochromatium palmeri]|uniref:Phosphoglycerate mutase n=1 Tax=Allochromatium palmeri TaxID=231048 RepID=A0A6N8EB56_9GAMM|nr:phosphoglycerate mutase [Allochromatium palmeri]